MKKNKLIEAIKMAWFEKRLGNSRVLAPKMNLLDFVKAIRYYYNLPDSDGFYPAYYIVKKNEKI